MEGRWGGAEYKDVGLCSLLSLGFQGTVRSKIMPVFSIEKNYFTSLALGLGLS